MSAGFGTVLVENQGNLARGGPGEGVSLTPEIRFGPLSGESSRFPEESVHRHLVPTVRQDARQFFQAGARTGTMRMDKEHDGGVFFSQV
jgi:hypothetical protein